MWYLSNNSPALWEMDFAAVGVSFSAFHLKKIKKLPQNA